MRAGPGDIVLVLGKGDENYEKLNTGTVEFNDIREAKEAIRRKNGEISDGTSEKQQPEKGI
jgi:UDP-N-acetylmuramyl tripeptide synthase